MVKGGFIYRSDSVRTLGNVQNNFRKCLVFFYGIHLNIKLLFLIPGLSLYNKGYAEAVRDEK